jgi:hypothetical protein
MRGGSSMTSAEEKSHRPSANTAFKTRTTARQRPSMVSPSLSVMSLIEMYEWLPPAFG